MYLHLSQAVQGGEGTDSCELRCLGDGYYDPTSTSMPGQ